jgi:hypothetical protein
LSGVDSDESIRLSVDQPLVVFSHPPQIRRPLELVRPSAPLGGSFGVDIEIDGVIRAAGKRLVDRPDVLNWIVDLAVSQCRPLVGVPGVAVAIRNNEIAVIERRLHDTREVVSVVGGVEKQLRQRVGIVGVDRAIHRLAIPRFGWLTGKNGVRIRLFEGLPNSCLPTAVETLYGHEHTDLSMRWGINRSLPRVLV